MRTPALGLAVLGLATVIACSGSNNGGSGFGSGGGSSGGNASSSGGSSSGTSGGGNGASSGTNLGGSSGGTSSGGGTIDGGFVCSPNPLNYDIPGNNCDDDDDGKIDNRITCDTGGVPAGLSAAGTAADFAAAIELCHMADATHWGVVSATYTNGHTQTGPGTGNFAQQHGTLGAFGSVIGPREGALLGVLSSGSATTEDTDTGPLFKGEKNGMQGSAGSPGEGDVPSGFPATPKGSCTVKPSSEVNDVIDVKLQIKVPANAKGISFDFNFWSGEWPDYVCSEYNDSFIAYYTSAAVNSGQPGNISFDTNSNPVSVNSDFFQACTPGIPLGCLGSLGGLLGGGGGGGAGTSTCTLGESQLAGTGFGQASPEGTYCTDPSTAGGATSWLTSTAAAQPGETISLELIIWDTGDESFDSSVLVDDLFWQPEVINTPITQPSPPVPQ